MKYSIVNDDVINFCLDYKGEPFHALLSDIPYELGFMGKNWDASGISFQRNTWRAISKVLYPGAFLMVFASARGFHRVMVAMEDAGLVIHPALFSWVYASGFPKATRIDTKIPNSDSAKSWIGHRYGLQALKPALEPIILAQKPYEGKPIDCVVKTGAGALNIDGGRILTDDGQNRSRNNSRCKTNDTFFSGKKRIDQIIPMDIGRWPSNFILQHTPDCSSDECIPECPVRKLGEQSGERKTNRIVKPCSNPEIRGYKWGTLQGNRGERGYDDSGTASRFFFQVEQKIDESDPVFYCAKASKKERELGCEKLDDKVGGGMAGTLDQSLLTGSGNIRNNEMKNNHPTVKPLTLCKYLSTLLLPPKEYAPRRLLVPFSGVSSEIIGAMQAGWDEIVGIELEKDYCEIGEARIKYWIGKTK